MEQWIVEFAATLVVQYPPMVLPAISRGKNDDESTQTPWVGEMAEKMSCYLVSLLFLDCLSSSRDPHNHQALLRGVSERAV
jgi:hypothetical protein